MSAILAGAAGFCMGLVITVGFLLFQPAITFMLAWMGSALTKEPRVQQLIGHLRPLLNVLGNVQEGREDDMVALVGEFVQRARELEKGAK